MDEEKLTVETESADVPVTFNHCDHIEGPFYHGTNQSSKLARTLVPGYRSNFHEGRVSNNVYFAALVETAVWGAELATALAGSGERGYIYVVEPTGPFEDDPNVTNKKFPGNITQSYRTRQPLRVVSEVETWERPRPRGTEEHAGPHSPAAGARTGRHRGLAELAVSYVPPRMHAKARYCAPRGRAKSR